VSQDIESRMRAALQPVAPSKKFSQQLLARVAADPPARSAKAWAWWLSASLAASLLLGIGIEEHLQEQRVRQSGLEARREVLQALRVTSQKLNLAYEAVKSQSTPPPDEQPGV
jgi:hypothetical protein